MNSKVLFFGNKKCPYSIGAFDYLEKLGLDVTGVWSDKRGDKIPNYAFSWKGDYIFSFQTYFIIPKNILERAKISINIHPAPPDYPGSGGPAWAIYDEAKKYGATAHLINEHIDNGKILKVKRFDVANNDTMQSLLHRAKINATMLFYEIIEDIFISKKLIDNLLLESCDEVWKGSDRKIKEVNQMRYIDPTISKEELNKRIKSFHSEEYPLILEIHDKKFILDANETS